MRICFLSDPNYVHTQRWAGFFQKRGHDVSVIGHYRSKPIELPDLKIYILDERRFRGPWIWTTTQALRRLLTEIKPDILHMHYLEPLISPVLLRFKPFLVSVWGSEIVGEHGLAQEPWVQRFLKRIILRRAHAVLSSSQFLARSTCRYAGLPPDRVPVYYWGVDLKQFCARERAGKEKPFVIGFLKHLLPKYGAEFLLRAIPIIRETCPSLRVLLVGDGPLRPSLEALCVSLGIADVVTFCGRVSYESVPDYVAQMDVMVMPSIYESETFGVAAAEAEAMGVPVIATNIGGIPEAISDGETGILIPPRDSKAIADAVIRLIQDPELRQSMSEKGPRFVAAHFHWDRNAAKVEALYERLLSTRE